MASASSCTRRSMSFSACSGRDRKSPEPQTGSSAANRRNLRNRYAAGHPPAAGVAAFAPPPPAPQGGDRGILRLPSLERRTHDRRFDDPHHLVAVGIVRTGLRALVRVKIAFEQRAQDLRINLRPVEHHRLERRLDPGPVRWQRIVIIEQSAVEPRHRLETDSTSGLHLAQQVTRQLRERNTLQDSNCFHHVIAPRPFFATSSRASVCQSALNIAPRSACTVDPFGDARLSSSR